MCVSRAERAASHRFQGLQREDDAGGADGGGKQMLTDVSVGAMCPSITVGIQSTRHWQQLSHSKHATFFFFFLH